MSSAVLTLRLNLRLVTACGTFTVILLPLADAVRVVNEVTSLVIPSGIPVHDKRTAKSEAGNVGAVCFTQVETPA